MELADSDETGAFLAEVATALDEIVSQVAGRLPAGAAADVDIALFVASVGPSVLTLSREVIQTMSRLGVGLTVSAYPTEPEDGNDTN